MKFWAKNNRNIAYILLYFILLFNNNYFKVLFQKNEETTKELKAQETNQF